MIKNRVVLSKYLLGLSFVGLLVSCSNDGTAPKEENTSKPVERALETVSIKNFERPFYEIRKDSFETDLAKMEKDFTLFFASNRPITEWKLRYENTYLKVFTDSVVDLFENKYQWKNEFQSAINIYQKEFVNDIMPEVLLWNSAFEMSEGVWGYNNQLIIGMDQYLGEDHMYYVQSPRYLARKKDQKYIVRDLVKEFSSSKVKADPEDFTFLNKLLKEGRELYFTSVMLPDATDDVLLNCSAEKMKWAQENEAEIWKYFINQELLFSTDSKVDMAFLNEAPFSKFGQDFDKKSPGKVAGWIGLQIIRSLAENESKMSLETITGIDDAQSILTLSKYKP